VRIGDVSLVQNSTKLPQCASEVSGENSCEILSLKVWNNPPLAPVPFRAFFDLMETMPPDPINHVCSLTGKYISKKYFTYGSVQIFKIIFRRFLFSRIWSSAQDHAVLVLLLNLFVFFISHHGPTLAFEHKWNLTSQLDKLRLSSWLVTSASG